GVGTGAGKRRRPRGSGTLFKRGGVWWGRARVKGRERDCSLSTGDRPEAKRRLDAWTKKLREAPFVGVRHLYAAAFMRWASEIKPGLKGYAPAEADERSTAKRYTTSLRQLDPFLGERYLDEI